MQLVGLDGNAFSILGRFRSEARKQGWDADSISNVVDEATRGDYNHLLRTIVSVTEDTHDNWDDEMDTSEDWDDDEWDD